MSQAELVRKSGVSSFTVRRVMNGEPSNYRADRLRKISTALGGRPDTIERILDGVDPVDASITPKDARRIEAALEDMRATIERMAADSAHEINPAVLAPQVARLEEAWAEVRPAVERLARLASELRK